jgi:molybdopterin-guanine dinucleotide biosynthesis protein MobB
MVGGATLLDRALRAVAPPCRTVVVAGGRESAGPGAVDVLDDLRPDGGPLAGLEAALTRARDCGYGGVLLLACDLPGVGWTTTSVLTRRWRETDAPDQAAVVLGSGDGLQPLCGVYGVGLLPELSDWLERTPPGPERSARRWVARLAGARPVDPGLVAREAHADPDTLLLNVNRSEDHARAQALPEPIPALVAVVGWKDAGKTTVAVRLVEALGRAGLDVAAFKHGHHFDVDEPGTDSWRLRHEGRARRVVLAGPEDYAVLGDWGPDGELPLLELAGRYAAGADIVVAEGWKAEPVPAIEVRPSGPVLDDRPPLCRPGTPDAERFLAIVATGERLPDEPPRLHPDRADLGDALARQVLARLRPDRALP